MNKRERLRLERASRNLRIVQRFLVSDTEQNFDHAFLALVRARNEVTIVLAGAASRARLLKEPLRART